MQFDRELDFLKPKLEPLFPESENNFVVPKLLTVPEFRQILDRKYPFHETSKKIKGFGIIHFPPEFELAEKRMFPGWEELKVSIIKSGAKLSYNPGLQEGVYLLKYADPTPYRIKEFHDGDPQIVIVSPETILAEGKLIDDFVDERILEAASTEKIEYVYDFEYPSENTSNHYHPFSLHNLDNPLRERTRGTIIKGINFPWAYYGQAKTSGFFHTDDHGLGSIKFHIQRSTNIFVTIRPESQVLFELKLSEALRVSRPEVDCPAHPRRKSYRCLVTLKKLREWEVSYVIGFQQEGGSVNYADDDYFHRVQIPSCIPNCKFKSLHQTASAIPSVYLLQEAWNKRLDEETKDGKWIKLLDEEIARREYVEMCGWRENQQPPSISTTASTLPSSSANPNLEGTYWMDGSESRDEDSATDCESVSEDQEETNSSKPQKRYNYYTPKLAQGHKKFSCEYCSKKFTSQRSVYEQQRGSCSKIPPETKAEMITNKAPRKKRN